MSDLQVSFESMIDLDSLYVLVGELIEPEDGGAVIVALYRDELKGLLVCDEALSTVLDTVENGSQTTEEALEKIFTLWAQVQEGTHESCEVVSDAMALLAEFGISEIEDYDALESIAVQFIDGQNSWLH